MAQEMCQELDPQGAPLPVNIGVFSGAGIFFVVVIL